MAARPELQRVATSWMRRFGDPPGAGACARSRAHAEIQNMPSAAAPRRSGGVSARAVHERARAQRLSDAITRRVPLPLPDPDPPLNELEQQGKAVFERACSVCHGGPGQSTTPFPIVRYHDILTQCPRPPQNPLFAFKPCPTRLARNARTYEIEVSAPTPPPWMVVADRWKIRRTSSDPGRALTTGFVGGPRRRSMTGTSSMCPAFAESATPRRTSTTTARTRSKRSSTTTSSSSSSSRQWRRRVRCQPPPVASTDGVRLQSAAVAGGARGAARVSAKAVEVPKSM